MCICFGKLHLPNMYSKCRHVKMNNSTLRQWLVFIIIIFAKYNYFLIYLLKKLL